MHVISSYIRPFWRGSQWLTVTGVLMLIDILICLAGLAFDHSLITGAPAWLKPLNFAISVALFCFTVAFFIDCLPKPARWAALAGKVMAAALTAEIVLIDMQAARHTTSHFNVAAPFDAFVWASMAFGILLVVLSTVVLTVNAFVARFEDAALGWVIRLSLVIVLAGMFSGGVMSQPTHSQLAQAKAGNGFPVSGAHTVGAPDGGPGVPVTNWSMEHGDLRVAHFLGFHGMQVLLLTWWVTKGRENWPAKRRTRLIFAIAASYSGVLILVMWQAFRAQSILKPDALTGNAWIAWLLITLACLAWALPLRTAGLQVNEA